MTKFIYILFAILLLSNCSIIQQKNSNKYKEVFLDFSNCLPERKEYNQVSFEILKGYKLNKIINAGFCEYQFKYKDSMYFYVSSNIYSGSRLNFENTFSIGVNTYAVSRSYELVDTFRNEGVQENEKYWLEYILGDIVFGYLNIPSEEKHSFDLIIDEFVQE